ncbi:MAG: hypothetical protein L0154_17380 [Chloroflexi bacterium]|nr:hypothetical protein [Chloroflexota bacterium]
MNVEKWVASLMWALLLAALVFTSVYAFVLIIGLDVYNAFLTSMNTSRDIFDTTENVSTGNDLAATEVFALLLSMLSTLFLVLAWLNFASLSTYLIKSLALNESPFASFLILPLDAEDTEDLALATGTTVSNVVRFLGFAWGVLLVSPALLKVLAEIVGD